MENPLRQPGGEEVTTRENEVSIRLSPSDPQCGSSLQYNSDEAQNVRYTP